MLKVGLTGGLASGKSFVGATLAELGCRVLQADALGHEVLAPDGEAYSSVVEAFGEGILGGNGAIDRRRLAAEVFGHPDRLAQLNTLVHPWVLRKEEEWMERVAAEDARAIAVLEAAILIETGSYKRFARLILAVCSEEEQVRRAMKRDGLSRDEVLARLNSQMPLSEKQKYADYVIDTSGTKEETRARVAEVYRALREAQP
ncbi:MAG: dephospho-CoA kinase [Bryobacterales bacterium]|nr:dephospho-CoA kinase [Bryobacterales bacterium]